MAQTLWIGNIHFEGVNIPVKLHTSVNQDRIQFNLFHKTDGTRLRQQMICAYDKKPVPASQQQKGFRVDERKYILMGPGEIERTEPAPSRSIEVHEFVETEAIDPVFLERTYYLEPAADSRGYLALAAALNATGKQGVCTWAMRKREHVGTLRSDGGSLRLTVLRFADEVRAARSLKLGSFPISEKELSIAGELINKLTVHFHPERYPDEHRKKVMALIGKKARGEKIVLAKPRSLETTSPGQLLEALEKSLQKAGVR